MPEIRHQQPNASPEIELGEIHIPDDADWGIGSFTTVLAPNALKTRKVISSIMLNPPAFQISMTVNPNGDVMVGLGRADESQPSDQRTFLFPDTPRAIKFSDKHEIRVSFIRWNITSAFLDGNLLAAK